MLESIALSILSNFSISNSVSALGIVMQTCYKRNDGEKMENLHLKQRYIK